MSRGGCNNPLLGMRHSVICVGGRDPQKIYKNENPLKRIGSVEAHSPVCEESSVVISI